MGKVVLILAVICTGLGLTSLHLVNQLREGDATIAELQTQVTSLQEQLAAPRPAATFTIAPAPIVAGLIEQPSSVAPAPATNTNKEAPKAAAAPTGGAVASMLSAPPSREETIRMMREHRERQRQLMQDPEYREAMRMQARSNLPRQYPGVIQDLGLDAQQADEFFDMLADQQMKVNEQMEPLWDAEGTDNADPTAMQARHRKIQQATSDLQRKNEAELAARFGQDKLQAWKEYQSTVGQRYQLEHMRNTLAAQGVPLSDDVSKPMLKALASVQRAEMEEYAAATNRGAAPVLAARAVAGIGFQGGWNMDLQIESTKKRNQRTLDAISPYLTLEQRAAVEKEQEAQLKMLEVQQRLMRARDDGNPNSRFYSEGNAVMMVPAVPQ